MDVLAKLQKAKAATGSSGSNRKAKSFSTMSGLWVQLEEGDNVVRLGGNVAVCERHYIKDLVSADALKPKGEERAAVSTNVTCMNWDIDNQSRSEEELHCCPICDLRLASNIRRKEAKESEDQDLEKKMKEISGKSFPRSRYSWDAISRADPIVKTKDPDGNETEGLGWKILNLGTEGTEAIEALAKQYPQIADPDEGCDVVVSKHQGTRITYGAAFALDGPNIKVTPLTDEEKGMAPLDLIRYIASHMSPRTLFESLKPAYQELITDVLGKTSEDYPSDSPVQKTIKTDSGSESEESSEDKPKPPVRRAAAPKRRAASVADEFEDASESPEKPEADPEPETESEVEEKPEPKNETFSKKPSPPKPPKAPSKPKPPSKPAKPTEEAKEEEPAEEAPTKEAPEDDLESESDEDTGDIKPSCFGYYDDSDGECKKCKKSDECKSESTSK